MVNIRQKIKTKIQAFKGKKLGGLRGQGFKLGGGTMIEKAKSRVQGITAKIKERKPGLVTKIKEFRPGSRIKDILSPAVVDQPGLSVVTDRPAKPYDGKNISVEW